MPGPVSSPVGSVTSSKATVVPRSGTASTAGPDDGRRSMIGRSPLMTSLNRARIVRVAPTSAPPSTASGTAISICPSSPTAIPADTSCGKSNAARPAVAGLEATVSQTSAVA